MWHCIIWSHKFTLSLVERLVWTTTSFICVSNSHRFLTSGNCWELFSLTFGNTHTWSSIIILRSPLSSGKAQRSRKAFMCGFSFVFCFGNICILLLEQSKKQLMISAPKRSKCVWATVLLTKERGLSEDDWRCSRDVILLNQISITLSYRLERLSSEDGTCQVCTASNLVASSSTNKVLPLWKLLEQPRPFPSKLVLPDERFAMRRKVFKDHIVKTIQPDCTLLFPVVEQVLNDVHDTEVYVVSSFREQIFWSQVTFVLQTVQNLHCLVYSLKVFSLWTNSTNSSFGTVPKLRWCSLQQHTIPCGTGVVICVTSWTSFSTKVVCLQPAGSATTHANECEKPLSTFFELQCKRNEWTFTHIGMVHHFHPWP